MARILYMCYIITDKKRKTMKEVFIFLSNFCSKCARIGLPSVDKEQYDFSRLKLRPALLSSVPGVSPAASSAALAVISAPEKL